jgi:two-component system response regulator YesN
MQSAADRDAGILIDPQEGLYEVLLVDDECLELELLKDNVPWDQYGFSVCGCARNGREALSQVEVLHPDVVITDIKMPVMDGVALSNALFEEHPNIVIVFLTGYNQFEYIKNAFRVNASDFLIKPLDLAEMPPLLSKVRESCKNRSADLKRNNGEAALSASLKQIILSNDTGLILETQKMLNKRLAISSCREQTTSFYCALILLGEYAYLSECGIEGGECIKKIRETVFNIAAIPGFISIELGVDRFAIISIRPFSKALIENLGNEFHSWTTACSTDDAYKVSDFFSAFQALSQYCHQSLLCSGPGKILFLPSECDTVSALPKVSKCPEFNDLLHSMQQGNRKDAAEWLSAYYGFVSQSAEISSLARYSVALLDELYAGLPLRTDSTIPSMETKDHIMKKILQIQSPVVVASVTERLVSQMITGISQINCDPTQSIMKKICEYIEANYSEQLTVERIASAFNFSANYLSVIFKKATGKTVLEYITDTRLQKSIYLLQETNRRIAQIAQDVGYTTPSYYCSLFAKKYGVTPNQFRSRLIQ